MDKISINDWTLLSDRRTSKNFISPDGAWFLKCYKLGEESIMAQLKEEQHLSQAVSALGIPTPLAGDIVTTEDGSCGLIFQNIRDKKSFLRAIGADPSLDVELMTLFARMAKKLHSTPCDTHDFPSMDERILAATDEATYLTDHEKDRIRQFLSDNPKHTTCLHGDLHPGNAITSPMGSYFIDLSNFCYGDPRFDLAQCYAGSHVWPKDVAEEFCYMPHAEIQRCWELFAKEYAGVEGDDLEDFGYELLPYLMLLLMTHLRFMPFVIKTIISLKGRCGIF